jgi:hypothetical protein
VQLRAGLGAAAAIPTAIESGGKTEAGPGRLAIYLCIFQLSSPPPLPPAPFPVWVSMRRLKIFETARCPTLISLAPHQQLQEIDLIVLRLGPQELIFHSTAVDDVLHQLVVETLFRRWGDHLIIIVRCKHIYQYVMAGSGFHLPDGGL